MIASIKENFGVVGRILLTISIANFITLHIFDTISCEGPSMEPTVQRTGDIVLLDIATPQIWGFAPTGKDDADDRELEGRRCYRRKQRKRQHERIVNEDDDNGGYGKYLGLAHGDVVVCHHPNKAGSICKRILALPGDVVVLHPNRREKYRSDHAAWIIVDEYSKKEDKENMWDGRGGYIVRGASPWEDSLHPPWGVRIPSGHVWLEGDNPYNSTDSREYGPVPASLIVGRVVAVVFPPGRSGRMKRVSRQFLAGADEKQRMDDEHRRQKEVSSDITSNKESRWLAWRRSSDVDPFRPRLHWNSFSRKFEGSVVYYAGEGPRT